MLPEIVRRALVRAESSGFELSCEPVAGGLLAALAAAVPPGGRVLELGTGVGVGTAWLVHGLGMRSDAELVTVELDDRTAALARLEEWPDYVRFVVGDGLTTLEAEGQFDLIFADAPGGGKTTGLDRTIAALRPGGWLVVDDMTPKPDWPDDWPEIYERVRRTMAGHPDLVAIEIADGSGIIAAAKRR